MSVFKKFEGSNAYRYANALHAGYHSEQLKRLQKVDEETLETMNVSSERAEGYAVTVDNLTERSQEAQASTETDDTTLYDAERDRLLTVLFFLVASGLSSTIEKEKEAARTLDVILRVYKGIQGKAMDMETQLIRGLLADLKKTKAAEAVTTLRLSETVTQLETANNKFEEAKDVRVKNRQDKFLQVKTPELRKLADEQLEEIQDLIRSTGVLSVDKPESKVLLNMISDLIDDMNAVTRNFKTVFNQMAAQREANKKPEEGEGSNPEEGGSPDGGEGGDYEFVPVEK